MKAKLAGLSWAVLWLGAVSALAAPPPSGIAGRTFIFTGPIGVFPGPVVPAVVTHFPVPASFTVEKGHSGHVIAEVTSDANGDFALALHPGKYIIVPEPLPDTPFCSFETPEPFEVLVHPRQMSGAGFTYIADCQPIIVAPPIQLPDRPDRMPPPTPLPPPVPQPDPAVPVPPAIPASPIPAVGP